MVVYFVSERRTLAEFSQLTEWLGHPTPAAAQLLCGCWESEPRFSFLPDRHSTI